MVKYAWCDCLELAENSVSWNEFFFDTGDPVKWKDVLFHMDEQDTSCSAWLDLLEYVEECSRNRVTEFVPFTVLGDRYHDIVTLPAEIQKMDAVKTICLYASNISWLPREVGSMKSLEYLDVYTSGRLHWFPYEITRCKTLRTSRMSTRRLYGNYKYRPPFPDLRANPMALRGYGISCSVCDAEGPGIDLQQYWISVYAGTDVMPLLATLCSEACLAGLCQSADGYIQGPHRGGLSQKQPGSEGMPSSDGRCST